MSNEDLVEQIKQERQAIDLAQSILRLRDNLDFKKVISHYLFQERVTALALDLSNFVKDSPDYLQVIRELDAISYLSTYLNDLEITGLEAMASVKEAELLLNNED